jgi:hypothetical protein
MHNKAGREGNNSVFDSCKGIETFNSGNNSDDETIVFESFLQMHKACLHMNVDA